jgi:hypothetical protein
MRAGVRVTGKGDRAKALAFHGLFKSGPTEAIVHNLSTTLSLCEIGPHLLPTTTNSDLQQTTCYRCCPSVAYIDYARGELRHFSDHRLLSHILDAVLGLGHKLIRAAALDRQIQINNWLLATNPLPDLSLDALAAATKETPVRILATSLSGGHSTITATATRSAFLLRPDTKPGPA